MCGGWNELVTTMFNINCVNTHPISYTLPLLYTLTHHADVSREEEVMGRYLMTWSETEYTNAGEVMQNVGKMQGNDSQARYSVCVCSQ